MKKRSCTQKNNFVSIKLFYSLAKLFFSPPLPFFLHSETPKRATAFESDVAPVSMTVNYLRAALEAQTNKKASETFMFGDFECI